MQEISHHDQFVLVILIRDFNCKVHETGLYLGSVVLNPAMTPPLSDTQHSVEHGALGYRTLFDSEGCYAKFNV